MGWKKREIVCRAQYAGGYGIFNILPDQRLVEIAEIEPKHSSDLRITDYVAVHESLRADFLDKLGITHGQRLWLDVEVVEHRQQHGRDDQPEQQIFSHICQLLTLRD